MESQPQNPEFRINPENFHPSLYVISILYSGSQLSKQETMPFAMKKTGKFPHY